MAKEPTLDDVMADLQTELNRIDRAAAQELGVGSAEELQVLRLLDRAGPLRIGRLAAIRAAGIATVSARLDRLEQRGLLRRERDPTDRRAVTVALTDEGRRRARTSRRRRARLLASLDAPAYRAALSDVVERLRADDG